MQAEQLVQQGAVLGATKSRRVVPMEAEWSQILPAMNLAGLKLALQCSAGLQQLEQCWPQTMQ